MLFEARLTQLLPLLMLARIDGKSPVEYFNTARQDEVRRITLSVLAQQAASLTELVALIDHYSETENKV